MYRRPPLLSVREEENYDYLDEEHLDERQQVFSCGWLRIIVIYRKYLAFTLCELYFFQALILGL